jgi:hypothetical protein
MDLTVMAGVALIIALEKMVAKGEVVARLAGYAAVLAGLGLAGISLLGRN